MRWRPFGRDRTIYRVVAALGVLPIAVEVIRRGMSGWVPARDAAPTVWRAQHALGHHQVLVGMFTDSSQYAGATTFFPGPWQLYWMWAPIHLFGIRWGPLVSMGLLNILWLVLAGWFVKRRMGYRTATLSLVFAALMNWVLSPGLLVSPVPMAMVLPAFVAFVFGAWALAAGDEGVVPALSVVTNFLLLDHLVLSVLVPLLAVTAVGCWIAGLIRQRRLAPDSWPNAKHRSLRSLAAAVGVTLFMWLPAIIQQVTHHPGNLSNLASASGSQPKPVLSVVDALTKWLSLFVAPRFWFRSSRTTSYLLTSAPRPSTVALIVTGAVLGALLIFGGLSAVRRRDRPTLAALVLAVVASIGVCLTIRKAVGSVVQPAPGYVQSSWVVAMFMTFALTFALLRSFPSLGRRAGTTPLVATAVIVAVLNLPHATTTGGLTVASDATVLKAKALNTKVVAEASGHGLIGVRRITLAGYPYTASAIVALGANGIPLCADPITQFKPDSPPSCQEHAPSREIAFVLGDPASSRESGWRVLASTSQMSRAELRELHRLWDQITDADKKADSRGQEITFDPTFSASVQRNLGSQAVKTEVAVGLTLNPRGGIMAAASGRALLAKTVSYFQAIEERNAAKEHRRAVVAVRIPGVTDTDLLRWAELYGRWNSDVVTALVRSPSEVQRGTT